MLKVLVSGAYGRMGREVVRAVCNDNELQLVAAVDTNARAEDIGDVVFNGKTGIIAHTSLQEAIDKTKPDVMVDFTVPKSVLANVKVAIENGVSPVVGTTGLSEEDLKEIEELAEKHDVSVFVAPNFSIGAILMIRAAKEAAKYIKNVEIIEYHHDNKLDAPSGTAIRTAELISEIRGDMHQGHPEESEVLIGARGGESHGIRLHSVRMPGYVAHQEVIFGSTGERLIIRHDSVNRESYMPGVVMACKRVKQLKGLVYGLEKIMDEI